MSITFAYLAMKLRDELNKRIARGEITEAELARHLQVSYPRLNEMLKGHRQLTTEMADRALEHLDLSIVDLI